MKGGVDEGEEQLSDPPHPSPQIFTALRKAGLASGPVLCAQGLKLQPFSNQPSSQLFREQRKSTPLSSASLSSHSTPSPLPWELPTAPVLSTITQLDCPLLGARGSEPKAQPHMWICLPDDASTKGQSQKGHVPARQQPGRCRKQRRHRPFPSYTGKPPPSSPPGPASHGIPACGPLGLRQPGLSSLRLLSGAHHPL